MQENLANKERQLEGMRERGEERKEWEVLERKEREIKRLSDIVKSFQL